VEPIHDREDWGTEVGIRSGTFVNRRRTFRLYLDPKRSFHVAWARDIFIVGPSPQISKLCACPGCRLTKLRRIHQTAFAVKIDWRLRLSD
jgi:hypothetical protein